MRHVIEIGAQLQEINQTTHPRPPVQGCDCPGKIHHAHTLGRGCGGEGEEEKEKKKEKEKEQEKEKEEESAWDKSNNPTFRRWKTKPKRGQKRDVRKMQKKTARGRSARCNAHGAGEDHRRGEEAGRSQKI